MSLIAGYMKTVSQRVEFAARGRFPKAVLIPRIVAEILRRLRCDIRSGIRFDWDWNDMLSCENAVLDAERWMRRSAEHSAKIEKRAQCLHLHPYHYCYRFIWSHSFLKQ